MTATTIHQLAEAGANVILQVSAADLRQIIRETLHEERLRIKAELEASKEQYTMTRKEAAEFLRTDAQHMYRLAKTGQIVPVHIGRKVIYKKSDLERYLAQQEEARKIKN